MTLSEKCKLWCNAGHMYNIAADPIISDETFDGLSKMLLEKYSKLPKWFTSNVPESNLKMGSTIGLEKFLRAIFEV